jgi:subtilisin family serine protease
MISGLALTINNQSSPFKTSFAQNSINSANIQSQSNLDLSKLTKDSQEFANSKTNEIEYDDQKYVITTSKDFNKNNLTNSIQKEFPNEIVAIDKIIKNIYEVSITSKNLSSKPQTFNKVTDKTLKFVAIVNVSADIITAGLNILKTTPTNAFGNFLAKPRSQIVSKVDAYGSHGLIDAWQTDQGNPGIVINIIDSGFDLNHPQLQGQFVGGYNFVNNNSDLLSPNVPDNDHGTNSAGIIGGKHNPNTFYGVCQYCKMYASNVGILNSKNVVKNSNLGIYKAIGKSIELKHKIIHMGLGQDVELKDEILTDLINEAYNNSIIVVNAMGNENNERKGYAGFSSKSIIVSSLMFDLTKAAYSNFGVRADIAAVEEVQESLELALFRYVILTSFQCLGLQHLIIDLIVLEERLLQVLL